MKFILLLFLLGVLAYFAMRILGSIFGRSPAPLPPAVTRPVMGEIDISITDTGRDGMPVITIRSNGATLNIQSVKQDSGNYVISAEKQADNVAAVFIDKKT